MLPNLIVIGAQKAGTTSLHAYLRLHPEISMSRPKELDFFTSPEWNWWRGVEWYESHFTEDMPVRGESSPSYTTYPHERGIAERMHSVVPDAKLIYLVRDPIDRMVSQYVHDRAIGHERRSIAEAFSAPDLANSRYVTQGRYHMQLSLYLDHYPREGILILAQEDLLRDRRRALRRTFEFLGVNPEFSARGFTAMGNTSADRARRSGLRAPLRRAVRAVPGSAAARMEAALARSGRPRLDPRLRRELARHFAADAARLRSVARQELGSWSV